MADINTQTIKEWVTEKFGGPEQKIFFELGAHNGSDSQWLSALPEVILHAFEPDPRNDISYLPNNVIKNKYAISDVNGQTQLILSTKNSTFRGLWTQSSSILEPKNHLLKWPGVKFGGTVDVETITLDTYCTANNIDIIDFIWSDIQGAEGNMVRGAFETLKRTRFFYTEFSNYEIYSGQITLNEIMLMLPNWRILKIYENPNVDGNVLLENGECK